MVDVKNVEGKGFLEKLSSVLTSTVLALDAIAVIFAIVLFGIPSFFYGLHFPQIHWLNVDDIRFWIVSLIGLNVIAFSIPHLKKCELDTVSVNDLKKRLKAHWDTNNVIYNHAELEQEIPTEIDRKGVFLGVSVMAAACLLVTAFVVVQPLIVFGAVILSLFSFLVYQALYNGFSYEKGYVDAVYFVLIGLILTTLTMMFHPISVSNVIETSDARKYEAILASEQNSIKEKADYEKKNKELIEQKASAKKELIDRLTKARDGFKNIGNDSMVQEIQAKIDKAQNK